MFNPLVWLDSILLGAAQKFCDNAQKYLGWTKFRLEKWALMLSAISAAMALYPTGIIGLFLAPALCSLVVRRVIVLEREERAFLKNDDLAEPMYGTGGRVFWLLFFGYFACGHILDLQNFEDRSLLCMDIFTVSSVYFNSCIPRPPSKSKMREWYERALTALNDWLKPEPALVPVPVAGR